jgi:hypothetical protein
VQAGDASGVGLDEGDRVDAGCETPADVELQRERLRRSGGENLDGPLSLDRRPIRLVIVVPGKHAERLKRGAGSGQLIRETLPSLDARDPRRARHDDVPAADDLVELDGLRQACGREIGRTVVRGMAPDAEVVQQLPHVLGVLGRPAVVGRVELDDLIAHLRHGANGTHEVFRQRAANRVELDADRRAASLCEDACDGQRSRQGQKRPSCHRGECSHGDRT